MARHYNVGYFQRKFKSDKALFPEGEKIVTLEYGENLEDNVDYAFPYFEANCTSVLDNLLDKFPVVRVIIKQGEMLVYEREVKRTASREENNDSFEFSGFNGFDSNHQLPALTSVREAQLSGIIQVTQTANELKLKHAEDRSGWLVEKLKLETQYEDCKKERDRYRATAVSHKKKLADKEAELKQLEAEYKALQKSVQENSVINNLALAGIKYLNDAPGVVTTIASKLIGGEVGESLRKQGEIMSGLGSAEPVREREVVKEAVPIPAELQFIQQVMESMDKKQVILSIVSQIQDDINALNLYGCIVSNPDWFKYFDWMSRSLIGGHEQKIVLIINELVKRSQQEAEQDNSNQEAESDVNSDTE